MKLNILVYLAAIGSFYILSELCNFTHYIFTLIKARRDSNTFDLAICDKDRNIKGFISLQDSSIDFEELNKINKTLIECHNYSIHIIKK